MANNFHKFLATGFGSGYFPVGPGTAGSLTACLILWWLHQLAPIHFPGQYPYIYWFLVLILAFFFVGVFVSSKLEQEWGHDPSKIVIDEIVGMWIAFLAIPFEWTYLVIAFLLFRFFDILKPLFIKRAEKLKAGWGVMVDDVIAGIYANVVLQIIILLGF